MAGWDIRRIYLYVVSFATLMMLIFGAVNIIQSLVDFVVPQPYDVKMYPEQVKEPQISPEQAQKQEAERKAAWDESQRYYRIRRLIESLAMIVVALPTYLYHWRKIQRTEVRE